MGLFEDIRALRAASVERRTLGGVPWRPWESPRWRFDIGGPVHPSRAFYGTEAALALPALYAGAKILADGAACLPLRIYTKSGGSTKLYTGPTMFDDPSELGTPFDWVFAAMSSLILHGNAWGLITSKDAYGFPRGIEWIPPEDVYVEPDQQAPLNPLRTHVFVYGREMKWHGPDKELFHVKAFALPGKLEGVSVLRAFAMTIMAGQEAQRYGTDWYQTGGFPPGTFQNSEMEIDADQAAKIRAMLVASLRRREPLVYGRDWDYCCDVQTEMLTRRGWKHFDEIVEGDECLSLNPETGMSEWQPVEHLYTFDGPHTVTEMSSTTHSSVTTGRHRWPVVKRKTGNVDWTTTETMALDDRVVRAAPVQAPTEAKWSDSLVELVAWLWTEGHVRPGGMVEIEQAWKANPGHVARIRAALTDLLGAPVTSLRPKSARMSWREDRHGDLTRFRLGAEAGKLLSSYAPGKIVETGWLAELTRAQLELFIQVSIDADGCTRPNGTRRLAQRDRNRVDAFQVVCALAGYAGSVRENGRGMWTLEVGNRPHCQPAQPEYKREYSFNGIVWCPTTKHANWFARRKGTTYFTGNTPVTVPPSEAQFIDAMQLNATHIAAILNLPPDRIGGKRGDSQTYNTVEMSALQIIDALRPWLSRLEQAFSRCLPNRREVRFFTDALLKVDLKTRTEIYQVQRKMGLLNIDEIREELDREPLPGGLGNESIPLDLMISMATRAGAVPKSMVPEIYFLMDHAAHTLEGLQKEGLTKPDPVDPQTGKAVGQAPNPQQMLGSMVEAFSRKYPDMAYNEVVLELRKMADMLSAKQDPLRFSAGVIPSVRKMIEEAHQRDEDDDDDDGSSGALVKL